MKTKKNTPERINDLPADLRTKVCLDLGTGCWLWGASRDRHGYGQVNRGGRLQRAHRAVYESHRDEVIARRKARKAMVIA